jgi:type I restriction enzyme S subunit
MPERTRLKRLIDTLRPITYGIVQAGPNIADGVPYIRPTDMTEASGVRDEESLLRTSFEIARAYGRSVVQEGDLVISIGPSYGKVMIVPKSLSGSNLTQGTARLAPGPGIRSRWLFWALQTRLARQYWDTSVAGGTFSSLNLGPLAETPLPLPGEPDEQDKVADFLDVEVGRIDRAIAELALQQRLLDERRQALISAAISGQLATATIREAR